MAVVNRVIDFFYPALFVPCNQPEKLRAYVDATFGGTL